MGLGLLGSAVVLGLLVRAHVGPGDAAGHRFAAEHRGGTADAVARAATVGGAWAAVTVVVVLSALVVVLRQGRGSLVPVGVVLAGVLSGIEARLAVSVLFGRERPVSSDWAAPASGYAFPSGHTTAATAAAAVVVWAVHRTSGRRTTRAAAWIAAVIYAAAVGASRVWLGVHWPSDVLGGWLFGAGWTATAAGIAARLGTGSVAVGGPSAAAPSPAPPSPQGAPAHNPRPAQYLETDPLANRRGGWKRSLLGVSGVRTRLALASAAVMAIALSAAMLGSWWLLQRSLTQAATQDVVARVAAIADDVRREGLTATDLDHRPLFGEVVQILGTGDAVLASAPSSARPLDLDVPRPTGDATSVRRVQALPQSGADEPYVLAARSVLDPAGRRVVVVVGRSEAGVQETIGAVGKLVLGLLPLLVLLTGGGTYWFTGRALAPVEEVRRRVDEISSDRLDERVPVPVARDEVGRLARTMNDMLSRLQAAHQTQRRFVADAGHELRSPLATMSVTLDVARAEQLVPAENAGLLDDLQAETDRMSRLVDDLLLLAKADERGLQVRATDVDLDELAEIEARRLATAVGSRLQVRVRTAPARLSADRDRLQQVLRNLLDNAARHASSMVTVDVVPSQGWVTVHVSDDGPGIPAEDRLRVFDRFVRLETSRDRDSGGSGLGLAIVREIVTAHGGQVSAQPAATGGAMFEVRIPTPATSAPRAEDRGAGRRTQPPALPAPIAAVPSRQSPADMPPGPSPDASPSSTR